MRILVFIVMGILFAPSAIADDARNPAPDFTARSSQNGNIRLADLRGKVVMLNFWASWCAPCRKEMPLLNELYRRYSPAGFVLLGVNTEANIEQANAVLEEIPVDFPIVYDTSNKVSEAYKIDAMPTTVLIDRDGQLRYVHRGYKSGDEEIYREKIRQLLQE